MASDDGDTNKDNSTKIVGGVLISDPNVSVSLPTLKYGYRRERYQWEELKSIIREQDLDKLSRSEDDQREYEIFRHHLKQQYSSIVDYILITKFDFQAEKRNDRMWHSVPNLQDAKTPHKVLVKNDFPYYTAPNIVHFILWKIKEDLTADEISEAETELKTSFGALDVVQWMNPPRLKSLPEIDHSHYLCLMKE